MREFYIDMREGVQKTTAYSRGLRTFQSSSLSSLNEVSTLKLVSYFSL